MTPADLYRTCRDSVYRLETLQHYAPGSPDDKERQRVFAAGLPLPPPGPGKMDDLRLIDNLREAGRQVGRVHVIDWPLSAYIRYELRAYKENVTAGEDIRIADRTRDPELATLYRDFVIADGERVILFSYSERGGLLGYEYSDDPQVVATCAEQYRLALAYSVPLGDFTAAIAA